MDTPIVLMFHIKSTSSSPIIRSITVKEYFSQLTSNVEVLYPTQIYHGLLLCKSKRTEEKILNMRHTLSDGSNIYLSPITRQLFQSVKALIDAPTIQSNGLSRYLQKCLPFLHASGGKIQAHPDGSALFEGSLLILNSIQSYVLNKLPKAHQKNKINSLDSLEVRCGIISIKIVTGNLFEHNVESIMIPMNDKYRIHRAFDRQIQSLGGTTFLNYFKELSTKGSRVQEGENIFFPNRELKVPAKVFICFIVPRLSNNDAVKNKSAIDAYQSTYEQILYRALQTIEQNNITSLALPILEPHVKSRNERQAANEMTVRAMFTALRQFSRRSTIKLRRFVIADHEIKTKRVKNCIRKYQKHAQLNLDNADSLNIDVNADDGHSFSYVFGVPKIPNQSSSSSESEDDNESEDYQLPYADRGKSS